ncbi:MAG: hypothetical protein C4291_06700 [Candidatus Dadabacteria bacterium]
MKVALIRNVQESRNLSMSLYADRLHNALSAHCDIMNVRFESNSIYRLTGLAGLRIQGYIGRFWSFPRQLQHLQAEVFHIVDHANAHLLRALDPARTAVTCHDLMLIKLAAGEIPWHGRRPWTASRIFHWSVNHLPHAGAVLCTSETTRRDIIRLVGCAPERLHVAYHGLDEMFRRIFDVDAIAQARTRFGITWPITVLHVGSNRFYKNLEGIIEALALLGAGWGEKVHLVKVGRDFTSAQRDLIRRRGMSERAHFLGQLSPEDLVLLYNVSDILLYPSLYEGFGWPPLEAMACGTPVVSSDRGSLKEVVGDAAIIVNPEDPEAIAEGVERVLTDIGLRQMLITRGIEQAKKFKWATTAEKVIKVYHEIAATH